MFFRHSAIMFIVFVFFMNLKELNMTEKLSQLNPETMNAADWLAAVHDIDPFHRPVGFVSKLCKNLKMFSNEQLVELFACRAITLQDFDEIADKSKLSAKDWAEILWNNPDYLPACPEEIWPLLTPTLWKSIPYIYKPYYLTPEQWKLVRTRQTDVPWAAFFEEHPEYTSNFPCRGKNIIGKP